MSERDDLMLEILKGLHSDMKLVHRKLDNIELRIGRIKARLELAEVD